jgi:UDP-4-amino-4,6-dideoxy-N-acetyl-beta-L-altrosamine transaminase
MSEKLAIHGGKPVREEPLTYGKHWIDDEDIQAVADVLRGDWITMGPKIDEFEQSMCCWVGAKCAVAVSSGTAALHGSMFGLGINPGDEVITTPMTFAATSNAILYVGGIPVFADIDQNTGNIDPNEIEKKLTSKTKAIIPVHFAGLPCDMVAIREIASRHNLKIVEDAAHALGAEYKIDDTWYKVGACAHSDMATFSFHPVKHITTGEGGMVLLNDEVVEERTRRIRMHGVSLDIRKRLNKNTTWLYEMVDLGYNYRVSDLQCALGVSQLKKLPLFLERRNTIAERYGAAFQSMEELSLPNLLPSQRALAKHAWHIYVVQLHLDKLKGSREEIFFALRAENIWPQVHYIPVHLHPYYQKELGYKKNDFPRAEAFYEKVLSLPLYPRMSDEDVEDVITGVKKVINYYRKSS